MAAYCKKERERERETAAAAWLNSVTELGLTRPPSRCLTRSSNVLHLSAVNGLLSRKAARESLNYVLLSGDLSKEVNCKIGSKAVIEAK